MNIELEEEVTCLNCVSQKVCMFRDSVRRSVSSLLSEIGNWRDKDNTIKTIFMIMATNCYRFHLDLEGEEE